MKSTNRPSLQEIRGSAVWTLTVVVVSLALIVLLGGFGVAFMGGVVKHKAANAAAEEAKADAAAAASAQTKSPVAVSPAAAAAPAAAPAPVAAATPAPTPTPAPAPSAASATAAAGQVAATAAPGPGKVVEKDGVQTIEITTHPMQFLYMVNAFTVKAGKKVAIDFKNTSTTVPQPHNIVICKVGKKGAIEAAAQTMMTDPKAMEKGYIPESDDILVHSKLLQPNESEVVEFTAPAAGTYDYLCTFPGHWILMKGVMTVE